MKRVSDYFGSMVFDDKAMKKRLAPEVYKALERTMAHGRSLDLSVANEVAAAMKDWAVELGARFYMIKPIDLNVLTGRIREVSGQAPEQKSAGRVSLPGRAPSLDEKLAGLFLSGFHNCQSTFLYRISHGFGNGGYIREVELAIIILVSGLNGAVQ